MANDSSPPLTARQRLIEWANTQDAWVRAIAAEAIATRCELSDQAIKRAYEAFLVEKELAAGERRAVPPLVSVGGAEDASEELRLVRLKDISGVNALAEKQEIAFNPRLTVLYGENAAGKTGYVRILKRLAAVRSAESILPNFRLPQPSRPRAVVEYAQGGSAKTLEWTDEAGVPPFTRMSVFDTRAAALHVDEDLTYVFTPGDLALYRVVHQAIDAVKARLDAQIAEAKPKGNPFIAQLKRDATLYPKLEALGPTTAVDELASLAAVVPADEARLEALRDTAESLRPEATKGRLQAAASDADFFGMLSSVAVALRTFDWVAYNAAVSRVLEAGSALEGTVEEAFAADEIPGSSLPSWRAFIEAAEEYLAELGETSYPHRGDDCLYCRQPLKAPAAKLIKRYRAHLRNSSQAEHEAARADLDQRAARVAALPVATVVGSVLKRVEVSEQGQVPPVLTRAAALLELAAKVQEAVAKEQTVEPGELLQLAREVEDAAAVARSAADELIASLKQKAAERQKALDETGEQLRHLENRFVLKAQLGEVEAFVGRAKWASVASSLSSRISSVLRAVTEQSKLANEEALNHDFERRFQAESEALRAPPVKLDFAGRKGQSARKKLLTPSGRLSEILSEGEQKVIALADFLAEASLRRSPAPIVFDDPVDSLDQKRLGYVVDRLAALSEERQVVVFTHNLWFAVELVGRFEKDERACTYYRISAERGLAGHISTSSSPRWDATAASTGPA